MFTGLVQAVGTVSSVVSERDARRLLIRESAVAAGSAIGDSIAIDGGCLTIVSIDGDVMAFQAGPETLSRTTHGQLKPGSKVNLERALAADGRLGGHFVQGHVDGVARIERRQPGRQWETFRFTAIEALTAQMVAKGSVAVDGISLTLVDIEPGRFSVALIPHTLANTTLGGKRPGDHVNIETDLIGKYVLKFLGRGAGEAPVDMDLLRREGFC
jgi:riboflavin synthase